MMSTETTAVSSENCTRPTITFCISNREFVILQARGTILVGKEKINL
jgi:hypothetical protein